MTRQTLFAWLNECSHDLAIVIQMRLGSLDEILCCRFLFHPQKPTGSRINRPGLSIASEDEVQESYEQQDLELKL